MLRIKYIKIKYEGSKSIVDNNLSKKRQFQNIRENKRKVAWNTQNEYFRECYYIFKSALSGFGTDETESECKKKIAGETN